MSSVSQTESTRPRLMFVARTPIPHRDLEHIVLQAYAAGLELMQLRMPNWSTQMHIDFIRRIAAYAPKLTLLLNQSSFILPSDLGNMRHLGIHLKEAVPFPIDHAPPEYWGRSVHTVTAAREAAAEGAHYLVVGTVFQSTCKPETLPAGIDLLNKITTAVTCPVYAIGGIGPRQVASCLIAGAYGIAVSDAIAKSSDIRKAILALSAATCFRGYS